MLPNRCYDTRRFPLEPPASSSSEAPLIYLAVNDFWWSQVDGAIQRLLETDAWTGTDDEKADAISQALEILVSISRVPPMIYSRRLTLFHDQAKVLAGNAMTRAGSSGTPFNFVAYQSPAANHDKWQQSVVLPAGNYTFVCIGITYNNEGKIDWKLDGNALVSGQDWYSSTLQQGVNKSTNITIASDGYHLLTGEINGKNASSSAYYQGLTAYYFAPASE